MNINNLLSAFSLTATFIYMSIGYYTYKQNRKSCINITFFSLCISYAIWAFAYAFVYVSTNSVVFSFWNKISALGWCSFSAISLFLVLLITENKFVKKRVVQIMIFLPAVIFLFMAVFLFGEGIQTPDIISKIFYIGDFLYNFMFLLMSILLLLFWGIKSHSKRIKKQTRILVFTSIVGFGLNLLTQTILPYFGIFHFPLMGQLYSVIMIIGTYIVITKYKFLKLPEKLIFEEVAYRMMDMMLILNYKGEVIKISKHTVKILGFDEKDLLKKDLLFFIDDGDREKLSGNNDQVEQQYFDIHLLKKNGEKIPVNISYIPIFDMKIRDFLGAAVLMQDISTLYELKSKNIELEQKVKRDSLTNLYNHQYSIELVKKEIYKTNECTDQKSLSLLMIDIDFFKNINDTYGHQIGDEVIKTVSDILRNMIYKTGHVGRFGGEEFIIILPDTGIVAANRIGEKIRSSVENQKFLNDIKLTISIGIRQYNGESHKELLKLCDDLLYLAKQNGRNRIEY